METYVLTKMIYNEKKLQMFYYGFPYCFTEYQFQFVSLSIVIL